jgi:hypothetical protein
MGGWLSTCRRQRDVVVALPPLRCCGGLRSYLTGPFPAQCTHCRFVGRRVEVRPAICVLK